MFVTKFRGDESINWICRAVKAGRGHLNLPQRSEGPMIVSGKKIREYYGGKEPNQPADVQGSLPWLSYADDRHVVPPWKVFDKRTG